MNGWLNNAREEKVTQGTMRKITQTLPIPYKNTYTTIAVRESLFGYGDIGTHIY